MFYESDKKLNPLETVDFQVNVEMSKLIFANSVANSLIFTVDGFLPTKSMDKTVLIIAKALTNVSISDKKQFAINRLKQTNQFEIKKIESEKEIIIDKISGYEIIALGFNKKTGATEKLYQLILFTSNSYYILFGSTDNEFEKNINELRGVAQTFKRK
ncbi:MAG: hypothetical protein EAZ08_13140 [Cytophagales bacterium]|nr:MAG: hypothetical protein EAZ08_13140 [Cytophagales bacterium]